MVGSPKQVNSQTHRKNHEINACNFPAHLAIVGILLGFMHDGLRLSPWMTRREAAEYLRWKVDELDANLVPLSGHPAPIKGKMRYLLMDAEGSLRVRVLAADVYSVLPWPPISPPMPQRELVLER